MIFKVITLKEIFVIWMNTCLEMNFKSQWLSARCGLPLWEHLARSAREDVFLASNGWKLGLVLNILLCAGGLSASENDWPCGIAGKAAAYDASGPYGCQLDSQVLHFLSSFLPKLLGKQ